MQARYSALVASTILGVLWALWHLPLFFTPSVGNFSVLPFPLHVAYMVPFAILMTWVFNSARGSVLIAMIKNTTVVAAAGYTVDVAATMRETFDTTGVSIPIFIGIVLSFLILILPIGWYTGWLARRLAVAR